MAKVIGGPKESQFLLDGWEHGCTDRGLIFVQRKFQNPAEPGHIHEVERKRALAGSVDSLRAVTLGQAQQFLGLPEAAPWELASE